MKADYRYLFFDLDGTLINSLSDITYALNKMREHFDLPPINDSITARIIGKGLPTTTQKVLALDLPDDKVRLYAKDALRLTLDNYESVMGRHTHIYPGVINALQYFRKQGISMAIVTNKEQNHALKTLNHLDLARYFDCIVGGDTTEFYKPHPAPLAYALKQLNAHLQQSLMIGDSANDAYCAQALNMPYVLISHGYANGVDLHSLGALQVIEDFNELKLFLG
jgi:phosphoglycolate phosphatase